MGINAMKARAVVRLKFPSESELNIVLKALEPEAKKPTTLRARESLEKDMEFLVLKIEAEDTVALRAAVNAYLRWIGSVVDVLRFLERQ